MKKLTALLMLLSLAAFTIGCAQGEQGAANGNGNGDEVEAPETVPATPDAVESPEADNLDEGMDEAIPESDEPAQPDGDESELESDNPEQ